MILIAWKHRPARSLHSVAAHQPPVFHERFRRRRRGHF